jgi:hypothetical protein
MSSIAAIRFQVTRARQRPTCGYLGIAMPLMRLGRCRGPQPAGARPTPAIARLLSSLASHDHKTPGPSSTQNDSSFYPPDTGASPSNSASRLPSPSQDVELDCGKKDLAGISTLTPVSSILAQNLPSTQSPQPQTAQDKKKRAKKSSKRLANSPRGHHELLTKYGRPSEPRLAKHKPFIKKYYKDREQHMAEGSLEPVGKSPPIEYEVVIRKQNSVELPIKPLISKQTPQNETVVRKKKTLSRKSVSRKSHDGKQQLAERSSKPTAKLPTFKPVPAGAILLPRAPETSYIQGILKKCSVQNRD